MGSTYSQKLRDPRWQRRRLEVLEAAKFACSDCGGHQEELHVHHRRYRRGVNPWEYPDHELEVLCKTCHFAACNLRDHLEDSIGTMDSSSLEALCGFAAGLCRDDPKRKAFGIEYVNAEIIGMFFSGNTKATNARSRLKRWCEKLSLSRVDNDARRHFMRIYDALKRLHSK